MLPSGSRAGGHRHKGPNGATKDVQEAPLRLGEPQRGSPHSLPARRAAHTTGRGGCGGGVRAVCHRLVHMSQRHTQAHININRLAYTGMCKHHQPGPSRAPSHLHAALRAKCIYAFLILFADIFIIQLSNEQLKHEY